VTHGAVPRVEARGHLVEQGVEERGVRGVLLDVLQDHPAPVRFDPTRDLARRPVDRLDDAVGHDGGQRAAVVLDRSGRQPVGELRDRVRRQQGMVVERVGDERGAAIEGGREGLGQAEGAHATLERCGDRPVVAHLKSHLTGWGLDSVEISVHLPIW
jgi:hypothetical protein